MEGAGWLCTPCCETCKHDVRRNPNASWTRCQGLRSDTTQHVPLHPVVALICARIDSASSLAMSVEVLSLSSLASVGITLTCTTVDVTLMSASSTDTACSCTPSKRTGSAAACTPRFRCGPSTSHGPMSASTRGSGPWCSTLVIHYSLHIFLRSVFALGLSSAVCLPLLHSPQLYACPV
jgi:hypothetical protein